MIADLLGGPCLSLSLSLSFTFSRSLSFSSTASFSDSVSVSVSQQDLVVARTNFSRIAEIKSYKWKYAVVKIDLSKRAVSQWMEVRWKEN